MVKGQSVMYLASAAGSGGILAGGGPFLDGSCRLSGVSLNCKGKEAVCIKTQQCSAIKDSTLHIVKLWNACDMVSSTHAYSLTTHLHRKVRLHQNHGNSA